MDTLSAAALLGSLDQFLRATGHDQALRHTLPGQSLQRVDGIRHALHHSHSPNTKAHTVHHSSFLHVYRTQQHCHNCDHPMTQLCTFNFPPLSVIRISKRVRGKENNCHQNITLKISISGKKLNGKTVHFLSLGNKGSLSDCCLNASLDSRYNRDHFQYTCGSFNSYKV